MTKWIVCIIVRAGIMEGLIMDTMTDDEGQRWMTDDNRTYRTGYVRPINSYHSTKRHFAQLSSSISISISISISNNISLCCWDGPSFKCCSLFVVVVNFFSEERRAALFLNWTYHLSISNSISININIRFNEDDPNLHDHHQEPQEDEGHPLSMCRFPTTRRS